QPAECVMADRQPTLPAVTLAPDEPRDPTGHLAARSSSGAFARRAVADRHGSKRACSAAVEQRSRRARERVQNDALSDRNASAKSGPPAAGKPAEPAGRPRPA